MKDDQIRVRISRELKEELQALADKDRRSLSNYLQLLIVNELERQRAAA